MNMNIKYFKQETKYTCGAASMRMALSTLGIEKSEKWVAKMLKTNTIRGTYHHGFSALSEKLKLAYIVERNSDISKIKEALNKNYVVIVCYFIPSEKVDHYAVVKKINSNSILLADPYYGDNHQISLRTFIKNWKSDPRWDNQKRWFIGIKK